MYQPRSLGIQGETLAADYLAGKGYRIVARNYRFRRNEIDIIATHGNVLCFVEVKTRTSLDKGHPAEAVTIHKQHEIIRAARYYLATESTPDTDCRFDVIAIVAHTDQNGSIADFDLDHIEAAFMVG